MAQPSVTELSGDNTELAHLGNSKTHTRSRTRDSVEKKRPAKDDGDGSTTYASVSSSSLSIAAVPPDRVPTRSRSRFRAPLSRTVSEVRDGIESRRDLEINANGDDDGGPVEEKRSTTASNPDDPNLVTWQGPNDPANPKNWAFSKKWRAVFIVSCFTLMSPLSSSVVAPSLGVIGNELDVPPGTQQALILSVFILAYAVGPLL